MSGGGKETPRQKMIGMMYLFYTALLALQVDTAVLEKFILINKTLEHQITDIDASNQKLFTGIETSVTEKGTRPDDKKVLDKAAQVRQQTKAIISEFDKIKEEIITLTGGIDESGRIVGAKDQDVVATMMITQGRGKEIQGKLNKYAGMLREVTEKSEKEFPNIARDAKDYDEFKDDPAQKLKPFAELFFESTPTGAGLSSLSQLESEVLQYETKALKFLGEQVGIKDVNFDQVFPLIRPESKIVAVGGQYAAEMFIAGSSSAFTPQMAVDDKDIPVDTMDINGMYVKYGKVEFNVSGGGEAVPGTRFRKKTFKAAITLNDSTYEQNVEYFTVNPVMQISSQALSALWRNCSNDLSVQVPELGQSYNPVITATNADIVKGSGRGLISIIPTSNRRVVLTVRNSGLTVGTQDFRVKEIPLPNYSFKMGNSELDLEKGIKASAIRGSLSIEAIAEENFKSDVPNDARYRIGDVDVFLKSGSDARITTSEKSGNVRLRQIQGAGPRNGEFLVIKINRVDRINYKGERERISTRGAIYTIPITN